MFARLRSLRPDQEYWCLHPRPESRPGAPGVYPFTTGALALYSFRMSSNPLSYPPLLHEMLYTLLYYLPPYLISNTWYEYLLWADSGVSVELGCCSCVLVSSAACKQQPPLGQSVWSGHHPGPLIVNETKNCLN